MTTSSDFLKCREILEKFRNFETSQKISELSNFKKNFKIIKRKAFKIKNRAFKKSKNS